MNRLPEDFDSVLREDRFCLGCSANLRGSYVVRETHYGMLIVRCPDCGRTEAVQEIRKLARAGQRWAGFALALWLVGLFALWAGGNAGLVGLAIGVMEQADQPLTEHLEKTYRQANPKDSDGSFDTSVQFINTPTPVAPAATSSGSTPSQTTIMLPPGVPALPAGPVTAPGAGNKSVQVIPAGPGRVIVIQQQDDDLRNRFSQWWPAQDAAAILADAGGYARAIPWRELSPWLFLGFVPLIMGSLWAVLLLNVSRWRLVLAWLIVSSGFFIALTVMGVLFHSLNESPSHVAVAMIAPVLLPILGAYLSGLLLIGMLVGRTVARGFVRLALSPRACSAMALLWLVDGKRPPRVSAPTP